MVVVSKRDGKLKRPKLRTLFGIGLAGVGIYALRRQIISWLLQLPPATYNVGVKRGIRIPMADGVVLKADHYYPQAKGSFPTILIRTYYGRGKDVGALYAFMYGFLIRIFSERGYHVLIQTTRGRFDSEGDAMPFLNEAADGRDTHKWITRQPWFNGQLGTWGASYLGFVQWAIASDPPPYLKALVPITTASQFHSLIYPDGSFALDSMMRWMFLVENLGAGGVPVTFDRLRKISPQKLDQRLSLAFNHLPLEEVDTLVFRYQIPYFQQWLSNHEERDPIWDSIDHSANLPKLTAPVHFVAGWYDIFLRDQLCDYIALHAAGRSPYLTIGPWAHTDGRLMINSLKEGLTWFDAHLKGDRRQMRVKPVRLFVMGADTWKDFDSWPPPAQEMPFYLRGDYELSPQFPLADSLPDQYRYDPANPTPVLGGALLLPPSGPLDNRAHETRSDVLCYTSPPLEKDLEVIGKVKLELFVKSSIPHTDFFGRLCDVHPDGKSINICDGLYRVNPENDAQDADGVWKIVVDMWSTAHCFLRGHRIRLQVSSGAHPRWSRNLGSGAPLASGTEMIIADQAIYHDNQRPSALFLPVIT
jgi:putative CocE/NonD family hydrolase